MDTIAEVAYIGNFESIETASHRDKEDAVKEASEFVLMVAIGVESMGTRSRREARIGE
jgi:hypothetical protein